MNIIKSKKMTGGESCPKIEGREKTATEFAAYLADESRTAAESVEIIYFPENAMQVAAALQECLLAGRDLTVSGARTGITGGAVPSDGSAVIALENLEAVKGIRYDAERDAFFIRIGAGVILSDLQKMLKNVSPKNLPWADKDSRRAGEEKLSGGRKLFYPVDPTETSAQLGGTIATNASGARTFHYGPTREWVESLDIVLASGEFLELRRGEVFASNGRFFIEDSSGRRVDVEIPDLPIPPTKHTAGYRLQSGMDAIDLFIGSEGTLGVITEAELRLTLEPAERLFLTAFLPSESAALDYVESVRALKSSGILAIEYVGPKAMDMLRVKREKQGASSGVPLLPADAATAVYTEAAFDGDEEFETCYSNIRDILLRCGSSPENAWAGFSANELSEMKAFRHALPETVNTIISLRKRDCSGLHKVGTDMAVPDERLRDVMRLYRETIDEAGLEYIIFGHIGDNHLHVNILPRNEAEVERAFNLYEGFAARVVEMSGSVSAEHGIGKLKRKFLAIQYPEDDIEKMRSIKKAFDPAGILNVGVLF